MITWMQRHKKYLVVTIWISTIAFVGAGFVGWGAYDLNSDRASAVAKVGSRKITVQEFQLAYANYYNFYNNMLGGKLTQEQADDMGLEGMVIKSLIDEATLLSYADEIGMVALDSEIKDTIANDDNFKENGVFSKELYYNTVKRAGLSAKDYENSLKKQILLDKLNKALSLKATDPETKMFNSAILMQDKIEVASLSLSPNELILKEEDIKSYWEGSKENYMTTKSYNVDIVNVPLLNMEVSDDELKSFFEENKHNYTDKDGKLKSFEDAKTSAKTDFLLKKTKKVALETYLEFKKDAIAATDSKEIFVDDITFPVEKLEEASLGETIKPIVQNYGYMILKVTAINESKPKTYEEAKTEVENELTSIKEEELLYAKAKEALDTFEGTDIGYVSRDSVKKILDMDETQSVAFINYIFDQKDKVGYKISDGKALLFRILEQKLLPNSQADKYASLINDNVIQMKQAELNLNLIKKLKERYEIEQYYKGK
jgi:peptidyl-prolyl cis-trans isomerase D